MLETGHVHGHNHVHPASRSGPRFLIFCLAELISGVVIANSSLVTSAIHDLFDGISLTISGRLDHHWGESLDHKTYCTKLGRLGIANALVGPAVSALGLLVESRAKITKLELEVAVILGVIGLVLNLWGLIETLGHSRLEHGYLSHFIQDVWVSIAVITGSMLGFYLNMPILLWITSLVIVVTTLIIGLVGAGLTYRTIKHSEDEHPHHLESIEEHLRHSPKAASS